LNLDPRPAGAGCCGGESRGTGEKKRVVGHKRGRYSGGNTPKRKKRRVSQKKRRKGHAKGKVSRYESTKNDFLGKKKKKVRNIVYHVQRGKPWAQIPMG